MEIDEISERVIDSAIAIHRGLGPGCLRMFMKRFLQKAFGGLGCRSTGKNRSISFMMVCALKRLFASIS